MLGALVVACEKGVEDLAPAPQRRRLTEGPPDIARDRGAALLAVDRRDAARGCRAGRAGCRRASRRAPIHLIFWNSFEQRLLLDGLARHFAAILAATPLYDFMTQIAAFNSPLVTLPRPRDPRAEELPDGLPVVAGRRRLSALRLEHAVAYREMFRTRLFDFWGKLDALGRHRSTRPGTPAVRASTARSRSSMPMQPGTSCRHRPAARHDEFAAYRPRRPSCCAASTAPTRGAGARRTRFPGQPADRQDRLRPTRPCDVQRQGAHAGACARRVRDDRAPRRIGAWKTTRLLPPERRALLGETLIVRYVEADQEPDVAAANRENERRRLLNEQYRAEYMRDHPNAKQVRLPQRTTHGERMGSGRAARPAAFGNNRTRLRARRGARTFDSAARRHGCAFRALDGRRAAAT